MGVLDAVADPVRLRVVRHLARHDTATLPELAEAAGVHVNTIRGHVASLAVQGYRNRRLIWHCYLFQISNSCLISRAYPA